MNSSSMSESMPSSYIGDRGRESQGFLEPPTPKARHSAVELWAVPPPGRCFNLDFLHWLKFTQKEKKNCSNSREIHFFWASLFFHPDIPRTLDVQIFIFFLFFLISSAKQPTTDGILPSREINKIYISIYKYKST